MNKAKDCTELQVSKQVRDLYSAKVAEENQGAFGAARGQDRQTESIVCLKMTSERRLCLGLADAKR